MFSGGRGGDSGEPGGREPETLDACFLEPDTLDACFQDPEALNVCFPPCFQEEEEETLENVVDKSLQP